ncbi:MAG: hypothetical protein VX341_12000 [Bdellovibrionota bacterium]|nr:hypothetical protein [Bdellovibrionota bacterium]
MDKRSTILNITLIFILFILVIKSQATNHIVGLFAGLAWMSYVHYQRWKLRYRYIANRLLFDLPKNDFLV